MGAFVAELRTLSAALRAPQRVRDLGKLELRRALVVLGGAELFAGSGGGSMKLEGFLDWDIGVNLGDVVVADLGIHDLFVFLPKHVLGLVLVTFKSALVASVVDGGLFAER
jgi:hypothetical protein